MKKFFKLLIVFSIVLAPVFSSPAQSWAKIDAEKFDKVDEGLYRGAQPSDKDLSELKKMGIKTIVNLRTSNVEAEKEKAERLGLRYFSLPMSGGQSLDRYETTAEKFLTIANDLSNRPVYAHCHYGIHRTGTMVAVYRMEKYGWSLETALEEMQKYGFNKFEYPNYFNFLSKYYKGKMKPER